MGLILDTDHCIAVLRQKLTLDDVVDSAEVLYVSAITVSELLFGVLRSQRVERNLEIVERLLERVSVLSFDEKSARQTAYLKEHLLRVGRPIADLDLQIAGTALAYNLQLVTHNRRHFERIPGLVLLDWLL